MAIEGLIIIGESINDSVPSTHELYVNQDIDGLKALAVRQAEKGAAYIDIPQFFIFFGAAFVIWFFGAQELGSYQEMLARAMANRDADFWQIFPPSSGGNTYVDPWTFVALIVIGLFLAGSPSAGEGWTAQRCLAAKNERHAVGGQMFNCVLSLVIRMVPLLPLGVLAIALLP